MTENEINHHSFEGDYVPNAEMNEQEPGYPMEPTPDLNNDEESEEGFTFRWASLLWGAAIFFILSQEGGIFSSDWRFYIYLAVVVIIHELGHVIIGKSFKCHIKEFQVFFLQFISYKPKEVAEGSSWRNIKWSLGVLPLGGVTVFKSRKSNVEEETEDVDDMEIMDEVDGPNDSPYIEDKPAWQRLLISAGGVLFNLATFTILYIAAPIMSFECADFFRPLMILSLILAVLNILPIYPLDGGAIVFALYEIITGNKPSQTFTNICGWIGFIFIILFFWIFPEWLGGILESVFKMFF